MKQEDLVKYIKQPSLLKELSKEDLEDLLLEYPYSQNIRFLLAQKSKIEKSPNFEKHLQLAATYMNSRTYLRQRLEENLKEELELAANQMQDQQIVDEKPAEKLPTVTFIPDQPTASEKPTINMADHDDASSSFMDTQSDSPNGILEIPTSSNTNHHIDKEVFFEEDLVSEQTMIEGEADEDNYTALHFVEFQESANDLQPNITDDYEIDDLLNQPLIEIVDDAMVDKEGGISDDEIVEGESIEDLDILEEIDIIIERNGNEVENNIENNVDISGTEIQTSDINIEELMQQNTTRQIIPTHIGDTANEKTTIKEETIIPTESYREEEDKKEDYDNEEDYEDEIDELDESDEIEEIEKVEQKVEKKKKKKKKKKGKDKAIIAFARRSIQENDQIVSETLAEILVKQGNIAKAVDMYERLSLIFPEKKAFFVERIQQLKNE